MTKLLPFNEALDVVRKIQNKGGPDLEALRAKCRWEQMTRTAVILSYGHPNTWGK